MSGNEMKIKTQVENCPGSSLCAPKSLESWPCIEIFAPVSRFLGMTMSQPGGMPTGYDLVIPENLPLKVLKSYLTQVCHKKTH